MRSCKSEKLASDTKLYVVRSVVHLLKAVVVLVVAPLDEDGSMIDAGAILAPSFEADMGGG